MTPDTGAFMVATPEIILRLIFLPMKPTLVSFFLSIDTESINFDHHLRCGGWLNFEFSKREKHSVLAIKTICKKLNRGMLKHIPLNQ